MKTKQDEQKASPDVQLPARSKRIPLPKLESLPQDIRKVLEANPLNVLYMMANAPASFKSLCELVDSILFKSEFDPRKREIAVLRTAHVTGAIYDFTHHCAIGKVHGVTDEQINTIKTEDPVLSLGDEDNLICRVADEITRNVRLSDEARAEILSRYGVRGATELIMCVSYYNFLGRFLNSTGVELEDSSVLGELHKSPEDISKIVAGDQ
jgi:4-carboxymuconolactone decarboxylase